MWSVGWCQNRKWSGPARSSECNSVNESHASGLSVFWSGVFEGDKEVRRGVPLMSLCALWRAGGQQQLPCCTRLTKEDLSKTSSSLWNETLPTVRLVLGAWQSRLLHHSAAGCWHSHRGAGVISSHPGRWEVVYIETEREYHMVAPGERIWWEGSRIKHNNSPWGELLCLFCLFWDFKHRVCVACFLVVLFFCFQ